MRKILVIEKQTKNLNSIEAINESFFPDCEFLKALSGKEGIELACKKQPDTIILCNNITDIAGSDFCKQLKENDSTKHIPILIIFDSENDSGSRTKILNKGADAFLCKPYEEDEIVAQVNLLLRLKLVESKLRIKEKRYKSLYKNAPLPYHSLNDEGIFIEVNPAWLSTLGYKKDEVIGKYYGDFLHPDWKDHFENRFPAFKSKGSVRTIFKLKHKTGHYIDIELFGTIDKNEDGSFKQTNCVFQDVTENRKVKNHLVQKDYLFSKAQEIGKIGSWELDILQNNLVWTEESYKIFGVPLGTPMNYELFLEIVHPDDRELINNKWIKALKNEPYDVEHRLVVNNTIKWVRQKAELDFNTDGDAIRAIGFVQDITLRKLNEQKIIAVEKNLQNTFDLSPSIIAKANMNVGRFTQVNKTITKLLGYTAEEFTAKPYMEFVHPDDRQNTIDIATEQLKGNEVTFFENRYLCKDGSYKWLAWHGTKPDKNGIVTTIGSDISTRKTIEQEIVKTKQFYENVIEGVQDGIWVSDKNDVIFYANSAMEKIAGVSRNQIQGNNVIKDFPEETTGDLIKYYNQAKKEKKPVWYLIKAKTSAQKYFWQNGWLIPQYQDKNFNGIICTIRDVTERKAAERSVIRLSTAVQQSPSMIVITDTEGRIEYVNPKFTEFTGYGSTQAIGQKSNILKSGEQDASFYKKMWKTIDSREVWKGQFHNKKRNGELFWEAASISAILNEAGEVINYIKTGEDITEIKQTEEELLKAKEKAEENEEKYKLLHENAGLGIGYYNVEGLVISYNSIASKDMNGVPEDFIGKSIFELFPKELADNYFERIQKAVRSDEITVYEDCVPLPTQDKWFLSTYTKIVNSRKEVLGIQIISQNISNIKQTEVELKNAKEQAEESDRLKSAFLANMSHEIRTPMNGILGFLELLADAKLTNTQQQNYIRLVNKSGERLLATINDIIEISRIESGEIPLTIVDVKINDTLKFLLDIFTPEAQSKDVKLQLDLAQQDTLLNIKTDSTKLEAILTNFIKNALKFTSQGFVRFGYKVENNTITFFVKDSGKGISTDHIEKIFERFIQADSSISSGHEGSGLGLSICRAYADMLGGKIWVESELGTGSTFYFSLSYVSSSVQNTTIAKPQSQSKRIALNKEQQILIAEDDIMSFELMSAVLSQENIKLIHAKNGKEALTQFKANPEISLILMDIKMPLMDGIEATKQIRAFDKQIPIIAQTAFALSGDKENALAAGCTDYISKPINRIELMSKIESCLTRSKH